jgi:hypothetical protein
VVETYGEYNQGAVTLDMEGRALSWEEESWDSSSPEKRLKTTKENMYSASGSLVGDRTRSVDQNGLETVTVGSGYTYDVSGRRLTSLEVTTYPGWKVTTDRLERNGMKYDALGRLIESSEKSLSEGPGLHKEETVKRTTTYDGAGRVLGTTEVGKRDGVDFETITTNTGFDRFGRPVAYHREERSEDGTINIYDRKGITFDGQGRMVGYTDAGYFGGTWRDRTVGMEYDAMGREVRVVEDGFDGSTGAYHNEEVNDAFNELGQVTAKRVTGSNATDGPYDKHETNLTYDAQGRVLQYDLEKGVKIVEEVEGVKHVPDGHDLEDEILKAEQEHGYDSDERLRKVINALHVFRDHMVACVYLDEHDLILQDIKLEQMTYVLTPDGKKQGKVLDIEGVYPSGVENSLRLQTPSANMLPNWSNPYAKTCPEEMCYQFGLTFSRFKGTIKSLGNKKSDINLDLLIADMMSCDPSLANADPAAKIYTGISLKKSLKIFEGIIDQLEAPELNQVAKAA